MATVTITLTDSEDGDVDAHASFDPRLEKLDEKDVDESLSPAQKTGLAMLSHAFPPEQTEWNSRTVDNNDDK